MTATGDRRNRDRRGGDEDIVWVSPGDNLNVLRQCPIGNSLGMQNGFVMDMREIGSSNYLTVNGQVENVPT